MELATLAHSITQAQPPLEFIPPEFNPWILRPVKWALPLWLRSRTPVDRVEASNVEQLVECFEQFQAGKIRLLIAFRHPSPVDPFCLGQLLWNDMPRTARQQGISLQQPHIHFLYDRGIPLWAGAFAGWLFSKLGGVPIHRGKLDLLGLRTARTLFLNGKFPMMAAPEGGTNGHNEIVSPLEPGISQLCFWCVEDLQKAKRPETVVVLPLALQYRYINPPWDALDDLLSRLEDLSGLSSASDESLTLPPAIAARLSGPQAALYPRLYRLGEHLLGEMEKFYQHFYGFKSIGQKIPSERDRTAGSDVANSDNLPTHLSARLEALFEAALQVAENYFQISANGTFIDRCRRLEQAGWDRIYRDDLKLNEALSPVARGLADRIAEEAALRMWHMRLVESFVAVTGQYVLEKPTADRFADTALLLWDTVTRIQQGTPLRRPCLGRQQAQITVGQPIAVSERWDSYRTNRRQAINDLTQELQIALESAIA